MKTPNKIVDRTTASTGFPDIMTVTTSASSLSALLRRRSLTIGRCALGRSRVIGFVVAILCILMLPCGCGIPPDSTQYGRFRVSSANGAVTIVDHEIPPLLQTIERPHAHFRVFDVVNASMSRTDSVWIEGDAVIDWNQYKAIAMTHAGAVVLHERFTPRQPKANPCPEFFISETDGELPEPASGGMEEFTPEFTHVVYQFMPAGVLWADYDTSKELTRIGAANQAGAVYHDVDSEKKWGAENPFAACGIPRHFDPANGVPTINPAMKDGMTSILSSGEWPTGRLERCFVVNRSARLGVMQIRSFNSEGQPIGHHTVCFRKRPYDSKIADVYWGVSNQHTRSNSP